MPNLIRRSSMGLAEADYDRMACELAVRFGAPPTANDVCWSLANERGIQLGDPRSSGYEIEQVYRPMAQQLHEEDRSHDDLLRRAHQARLTYEWAKIESIEGRYASEWRAEVMGNACCDAAIAGGV